MLSGGRRVRFGVCEFEDVVWVDVVLVVNGI